MNLLHRAGLPERVYGPNLTLDVLRLAERDQLPVYFYGSTPQVLDLLCEKVIQRFPAIRIAGAETSRFGCITAETADEIAAGIKKSGAKIVFVGLGCPRQEVWAYEFRNRLNVPIVAVGAAFPFIAGTLGKRLSGCRTGALSVVSPHHGAAPPLAKVSAPEPDVHIPGGMSVDWNEIFNRGHRAPKRNFVWLIQAGRALEIIFRSWIVYR